MGVELAWIYLEPFGYINETNLIGLPNCNNPFYALTGDPAFVSVDDPRRTAFGNHAFCEYNSGILDACAGPHLGDENRNAYLATSIDTTTLLYGLNGERPGEATEMSVESGVTDVL